MTTDNYDNAYGRYLSPLGFTKSDTPPDPLHIRWVGPTGEIVDVLPRRKYLAGNDRWRHLWHLTLPATPERLGGYINGYGHLRLLGVLALCDLNPSRLDEFVALLHAEAKKYAANR
jgi:hypothetical protein